MIRGKCLCGAVQFTVTAPFEYASYCHCSRCRAVTGSAHASSAGVRREHLRIDGGAENLGTYRRNADTVNSFCRTCGSFLFLVCRGERYAHVQLGALVDDPGIRPQFHMYVGSKSSWHEITDSLPQHAGLPERVFE